MYDVIVIGARCAGSPTAMLLARKGYKVLLADRKSFPSDTISTHFLWQGAIARLKHWGLLDALTASGCPPIRKINLDFGDVILSGTPPAVDGVDAAYAPRRSVLDKILIDAARESGAEVREKFLVTGIVTEGSHVKGITGSAEGGTTSELHARVVVGADGAESMVALAMNARKYELRLAGCAIYYSHWRGVAADGFDMYLRDGFAAGLFPTHDGDTCILAAWTHDAFPQAQRDVAHTYDQVLAQIGPVAKLIAHGRRAERILGAADMPPYFRVPFGDGWALVGDAGCRRNPITAQGIAGAFRSAELLSDALDRGLSGREPMASALAGYERQRNEAEMPFYEFAWKRSRLAPLTAAERDFYTRMASSQADTDHYLGTLAGTAAGTLSMQSSSQA